MDMTRKIRGGLVAGAGLLGAVATAAALASMPAQAAEGQIRAADSATAVAGSYIVVLKSDVVAATKAGVSVQAQGLAARYGGQVTRTYHAALRGFAVNMSQEQARKLAADGSVAYVEQNQRVSISDTQPNPPSWGLDRIDQRDLPLDSSYTYANKGDGVTAFIVDTGVRATHGTFEGRASGGFDAIDNDGNPDDGHGHGTHVAGTVGGAEYGVAKGVSIVPVRVLDDSGSGTIDGVVAGVDWVAQNHSGPSVANMSLGGGAADALDQSVRGAVASGVVFAVAAGNSGDDAMNYSPARVTEAVTVAASDSSDAQASFSNYGSVVDIYAPGVDITSSWNDSDSGTNTISGTSMATPHVCGAAALFLAANPSATPADVEAGLVAAATPDKITNPGSGTPNRLLYTGA